MKLLIPDEYLFQFNMGINRGGDKQRRMNPFAHGSKDRVAYELGYIYSVFSNFDDWLKDIVEEV